MRRVLWDVTSTFQLDLSVTALMVRPDGSPES
jgi:hypothetical protein